MVLTIRFVSDENDDFMRQISIDGDATFLDLRNALCDATGFSREHMHSFFLCNEGWEKDIEITLEDMGTDSSQEVWLMDESVLSDYLEEEGQRLIFVFDYLTDRALFGEVKMVELGSGLAKPEITRSEGEAPKEEIDLDEFNSAIEQLVKQNAASDPNYDLDDDFYGDSEYNDDELDPDLIPDLND